MLMDIRRPNSATTVAEFERCWPWLKEALESGAYVHDGVIYPTHDRLQVWQRIATGKAQLWPGEDCAILTEFIHHQSGLRSFNNWLAGGNVDEIVAKVRTIESWGYEHGCHRMVGNGRRGWLRKFTGYSEYGVRKQKDLLAPGETPRLYR
jgi:hypothetical protein